MWLPLSHRHNSARARSGRSRAFWFNSCIHCKLTYEHTVVSMQSEYDVAVAAFIAQGQHWVLLSLVCRSTRWLHDVNPLLSDTKAGDTTLGS